MALGPPASSAVLSPRLGGVSSVATRLIVAQFCLHNLPTPLSLHCSQHGLLSDLPLDKLSWLPWSFQLTVFLLLTARHMPLSDSSLAQLSLYFGLHSPFMTPSVPTSHSTLCFTWAMLLTILFQPHTSPCPWLELWSPLTPRKQPLIFF